MPINFFIKIFSTQTSFFHLSSCEDRVICRNVPPSQETRPIPELEKGPRIYSKSERKLRYEIDKLRNDLKINETKCTDFQNKLNISNEKFRNLKKKLNTKRVHNARLSKKLKNNKKIFKKLKLNFNNIRPSKEKKKICNKIMKFKPKYLCKYVLSRNCLRQQKRKVFSTNSIILKKVDDLKKKSRSILFV